MPPRGVGGGGETLSSLRRGEIAFYLGEVETAFYSSEVENAFYSGKVEVAFYSGEVEVALYHVSSAALPCCVHPFGNEFVRGYDPFAFGGETLHPSFGDGLHFSQPAAALVLLTCPSPYPYWIEMVPKCW